MIAQLSGNIVHIGIKELILDVNGVGYLVSASTSTLSRVGQIGEYTQLLIDTHVREDQISLFGFIDQEEKDWFKRLCTVQGVGAKVCLAILSVAPAEQLIIAIAAQDKAVFTRAEGVGPKLATRIVTELKDKVAKLELGNAKLSPKGTNAVNTTIASNSNNGDAISALINLGYGRTEAFSAVGEATKEIGDNPSIEQLIQHSLKSLSTA